MEEDELSGGINASAEGVGENGRPLRYYVVATARSKKIIRNENNDWTSEIPITNFIVKELLSSRMGINFGKLFMDIESQNARADAYLTLPNDEERLLFSTMFDTFWKDEVNMVYRDNLNGFTNANSELTLGDYRWDVRLQKVKETPEPTQKLSLIKALERLSTLYTFIKSLPLNILQEYLPGMIQEFGEDINRWPNYESANFPLNLFVPVQNTNLNLSDILHVDETEEQEQNTSMMITNEECEFPVLENNKTFLRNFNFRCSDIKDPKTFFEQNNLTVTKVNGTVQTYNSNDYDIWELKNNETRRRSRKQYIVLRPWINEQNNLSKILNVYNTDEQRTISNNILFIEDMIGTQKEYLYLLFLHLMTLDEYKKYDGLIMNVKNTKRKNKEKVTDTFCPFVDDMAEKHVVLGFQRMFNLVDIFGTKDIESGIEKCNFVPKQHFATEYIEVFNNQNPKYMLIPKTFNDVITASAEFDRLIDEYRYGNAHLSSYANATMTYKNFRREFKGMFMYRPKYTEKQIHGSLSMILEILNAGQSPFLNGGMIYNEEYVLNMKVDSDSDSSSSEDERYVFEKEHNIDDPWNGKIFLNQ